LLLLTCVLLSRPAAALPSAESQAAEFAAHDTSAYTLPAAKLVKAHALARVRDLYALAEAVWLPLAIVLLLEAGLVARMRDAAARFSRYTWLPAYAFVFLFLLATDLLLLPLDVYRHHIGLAYGLSVQGWPSWFADQAKTFALAWVLGGLLTVVLIHRIRRSPRLWWFRFWMVAVAFVLVAAVAEPYLIEPLFNKFVPLAQSDPALVQRLELVVSRGGISIPPERMFLMKASDKVTTLNAYVSGFGPSKRVVVWDTTIAKASPDEIAFIFAHEMGHYALGHIVQGLLVSCAGLLLLFWLGFHGLRLLLARFGTRWRIPAQEDLGALAVLVLVLVALSTLADPIQNAFSRTLEHHADVYGQEAIHGIVANPQSTAQRAFQVLGEDSLDDPEPDPVFEFWFGNHPPIPFRAAFAQAYNPWAPGERPVYFHREEPK
jgi:Zn-dependent protease with chaperone function